MLNGLINPADTLERQNSKLLRIVETLMRRAEQGSDSVGLAYAHFERAVLLEDEVRARTQDLQHALELLNDSNRRLAQANAETEAARANLANAIETVQEGFALFNAQDEMVLCNSRFGRHMRDVHDRFKPGIAFADYVRMVSESPYMSLPDGVTPAEWTRDRLARHKDSHVVFNARMVGRRWLQVSEHRTPDGGTVVLQTDVTDMVRLERRERERLLDDQARLIRATLEHLDQGVCIFDRKNRLAGWNRRVGELLSVPIGRFFVGASFDGLYDAIQQIVTFSHPDTHDRITNWVRDRTRTQPLSFEFTLQADRTVTVFAQQMPDGGFVISFTDVSAERAAVRALSEVNETLERHVTDRTLELEDALSEAERANASKSRFVAAASHDLLQPLSAAKLFVAALESDLSDPVMLDRISKASKALVSVEHILGALLDISKLDSGRAEMDITAVHLGDMLDQLHDELAPLAAGKGLRFAVVGSSVIVRSDATYLRRILQNLISNAVRYTETGKVLVGVRPGRSVVRVDVWDTGPGIPEDQQDQVFDEFQRLNASVNPADGMGLGLAIVERACRLLGHPLQLQSEVRRGTRFSVELPRLKAQAQARIISPAAPETMTNQIVLLIENDTALRQAITVTLEGWGLDVFACASLADAQNLLQEVDLAPDTMLVDYQLDGGLLGTDAISELRSRYGPIPACVISANRSPHLSDACHRIGVALLHKPLEPEQLRRVLRRC